MRDLKKIYRAVNKEVAEDELLNLEEKWGQKYPVVIESRQRGWEELSQYFEFTEPIRRSFIPLISGKYSTARSVKLQRPKEPLPMKVPSKAGLGILRKMDSSS